MHTVIAYMRISTAEQGTSGLGVEAQKAAIELEANRRSWRVSWVTDEASGKSMSKRPGIAEARRMLKSGEAEGIVVAKLDRLSRSMFDFADLMRDAQREGWAVIALDLGVDTSTPNGKLVANVMMSVAEWERERIGERTREALGAAKRRGTKLGRREQIPNDVRTQIRKWHQSGMSLRAIAGQLQAAGIPTARGGAWTPGSVHYVLKGAA